ncbi:hypothetical protein M747DRAFT_367108, partial [Aspergillus niger ATCC 13496]
ESCLSEAPLCDGLLLSHLGSIVFGPCRSSAAGSYVIPSKPPSLLVHSAAILKSSKSHTPNPPKQRLLLLLRDNPSPNIHILHNACRYSPPRRPLGCGSRPPYHQQRRACRC